MRQTLLQLRPHTSSSASASCVMAFSPSPSTPVPGGAPSARTIPPTLDRLQLVMDYAVTWVPHLPEQHLPAATRTSQWITARTGQHALPVGLPRRDTIRPLDQPTQCHH